jgi:thiamine biosynthesis lipoprotein
VIASASFAALGTTAFVAVTDRNALPTARALLERELGRLDETCSRFRRDSELTRANRCAGSTVQISGRLAQAVAVALTAARATDGLVEPTLGGDLRAAGYDRTFALVHARACWTLRPVPPRTASWREVELDTERRLLRVPEGVELDLGATAKAWAADRAAGAIATRTGAGVLVSLGGDIAAAGPPPAQGWSVRIADDHAAPLDAPGPAVAIAGGGLATSSTSVRRWRTDRGDAHHVVDPRSRRPAVTPWRTITVAGATCVDANVAATAALVLGASATEWLAERRVPARLVRRDGIVRTTGGWPAEAAAA